MVCMEAFLKLLRSFLSRNKLKLFDCFACFINFIINLMNLIADKYMNWTDNLEYCKENDNYPFGNINLSNVSASCTGFNHTNQRWIGVVKEDFVLTDDGIYLLKGV